MPKECGALLIRRRVDQHLYLVINTRGGIKTRQAAMKGRLIELIKTMVNYVDCNALTRILIARVLTFGMCGLLTCTGTLHVCNVNIGSHYKSKHNQLGDDVTEIREENAEILRKTVTAHSLALI